MGPRRLCPIRCSMRPTEQQAAIYSRNKGSYFALLTIACVKPRSNTKAD